MSLQLHLRNYTPLMRDKLKVTCMSHEKRYKVEALLKNIWTHYLYGLSLMSLQLHLQYYTPLMWDKLKVKFMIHEKGYKAEALLKNIQCMDTLFVRPVCNVLTTELTEPYPTNVGQIESYVHEP